MGRRIFSREFKVEAVRLVREQGLAPLCRVLFNSNEFILVD